MDDDHENPYEKWRCNVDVDVIRPLQHRFVSGDLNAVVLSMHPIVAGRNYGPFVIVLQHYMRKNAQESLLGLVYYFIGKTNNQPLTPVKIRAQRDIDKAVNNAMQCLVEDVGNMPLSYKQGHDRKRQRCLGKRAGTRAVAEHRTPIHRARFPVRLCGTALDVIGFFLSG